MKDVGPFILRQIYSNRPKQKHSPGKMMDRGRTQAGMTHLDDKNEY